MFTESEQHKIMNKRAESITITWGYEDVHTAVGEGILTDDQAKQVLWEVNRSHDASVGINWDTLRTTAEIMFNVESDSEY